MSSIESLEGRALLAGDGFAHITSKGTLDVVGDSSSNLIIVFLTGDSIVASCDGDALSFPAAAVKRVGVSGGDGDDQIFVETPRPSIILGQGGSDTIRGGAGDDQIDGGAGDDVFSGGAGDNELFGGEGVDAADYFEATEAYALRVGEFPFDDPHEGFATPRRRVSGNFPMAADGAGEIDLFLDRIEFFGMTSRDDLVLLVDFIQETNEIPATIDARGGDDLLRGFGQPADGDLIGSAGDDFFDLVEGYRGKASGGSGNDFFQTTDSGFPDVHGDGGIDTLRPGRFRDLHDLNDFPGVENLIGITNFADGVVVIGTDGPNLLSCENAEPGDPPIRVYGLGGDDTIIGSEHPDLLFGGEGDDVIAGGNGDDTLRGDGGNDAIGGNGGNDRLYGHGGNDDLNGGSGADRLDGGTGTDTFNGGAGNDRLFSRDTIAEGVNGGSGDDTAEADDELDALFSVEIALP